MYPNSHGNHGFPLCTNGFCSVGLAELQQHQHPQQHQQRQPQYQPQQQQQQPQPQQQQQQQPQHIFHITDPHVHASIVLNSRTFVSLLKKQRQETDQLINIQNDQIKLMLQHQIRELQETALRNMNIYSRQIMSKANVEIAKAKKKNQEMENIVINLETEKGEWKRIAEERGASTIALHKKLEEEKKRMRMVVNDVESCCGENDEARAEKRMRCGSNMMLCMKCNTNSSCVLFLPCRHLSSCKQCEALLQTCPICGMTKKGVIEIQSLTSD